jgi:hypothetical protein
MYSPRIPSMQIIRALKFNTSQADKNWNPKQTKHFPSNYSLQPGKYGKIFDLEASTQ